jgi:Phage Mu protein F like protein
MAIVRAWRPVSEPRPVKAAPSGVDGNPDDLPAISLTVAPLESTTRRALLQAWAILDAKIDWAAVTGAAARYATLDVDRLLLSNLQAALLSDVLTPRLVTGFMRGAGVAARDLRAQGVAVKQLTVDLQGANAEAVRWAQQHAGTLITAITAGQLQALRQLIARANAEGIDPDETARRVRRILGLRPDQEVAVERFRVRLIASGVAAPDVTRRTAAYAQAQRRQRAQAVARTELVSSSNAGQIALWRQAVQVGAIDDRRLYKKWIVTDDERLCDICEALGEHLPIPIAAQFPGGYDRPTAHTNCRCALGLVPAPAVRP